MKRALLASILFFALSTTLSSCYRSSCEMWEDTKTCGRYMGKGVRSFFGHHADPKKEMYDFGQWSEDEYGVASAQGENEFIPLADREMMSSADLAMKDYPISQESPGDPGSNLPGIEGFLDPSGELTALFNKIHFETDHYTIKGGGNVSSLRNIASYLASHPKTYVFIAGHADERGAAAYNLALGAKRANAVRGFLIDNGVNPDQLFTISYGLERPVAMGHDESSWYQNRRAEFKLYDR
jgi:peptidoglycan-associated lipoprotein